MRQHAPLASRFRHIAQRIHNFTNINRSFSPCSGFLLDLRRNTIPFLVVHVRIIGQSRHSRIPPALVTPQAAGHGFRAPIQLVMTQHTPY